MPKKSQCEKKVGLSRHTYAADASSSLQRPCASCVRRQAAPIMPTGDPGSPLIPGRVEVTETVVPPMVGASPATIPDVIPLTTFTDPELRCVCAARFAMGMTPLPHACRMCRKRLFSSLFVIVFFGTDLFSCLARLRASGASFRSTTLTEMEIWMLRSWQRRLRPTRKSSQPSKQTVCQCQSYLQMRGSDSQSTTNRVTTCSMVGSMPAIPLPSMISFRGLL